MTALQPLPSTLPSVARSALPEDDRGLVQAHLDGVDGAFDALYARYQPRLVAFLAHRVGDAAAADDLAQETMIRAMHGLHRFDVSRPLWPWLRRIATNAAIDLARARTRADAVSAALAREPVPVVDVPDVGERELLSRALAKVPARQRDALRKCYLEGWRPVDVAEQFGVGSNAFEQLLHRARRSLRRAYGDGDRVAGPLWLLPLVAALGRPWTGATERVRRLAALPHLTEAAVASVAVATAVAIAPGPAPAPRVVVPPRPDRVSVAPADHGVGPVAPGAPVDAAAPATAPSAGRPPATQGDVAEGPLPVGAGRPAPVAVRPRPAPRDGAAGPVAEGGESLPGETGVPGSSGPVAGPPPTQPREPSSPAEVLGGCGSTVRSAVCTAVGAVAQ